MGETGRCADCGAALEADHRYCPACGQKAGLGRLTLHEIAHEVTHALFHVDRSVVSLLRRLVTAPGVVARDYVEGRRRRQFGPFSFLFIAVGLATAAVTALGFRVTYGPASNRFAEAVQHHANLAFLVQVPLLTLYCRVLFRGQRFNFAETLVLAAYTGGMRVLLWVLALLPAAYVLRLPDSTVLMLFYGFLVLWFGYFAAACSQFYAGRRLAILAKGFAAAVLSQATMQGAVFIVASLLAPA